MDLKTFVAWEWQVVVALTAVALSAAGVYYKIYYDYWKRRGFPELPLKPMPFFGHTTRLLLGRTSFADAFHELYKYAGDKAFVGYFHGSQPSIMLRDPEIIKHVLIKDFHVFVNRNFGLDEEVDPLNAKGLFNLRGHRWKEMRARLSPTFTSGRMKAMFPLMLACADELNESFSKNIEKKGGETTADIKEYMACYSTDVIATCAFGIHCDALKNPEASEFRRMGKLVFEPTLRRSILIMLFLISPKLLKWTGMKFTDDLTSSFFSNFVQDMVEQREKAIEQNEKTGGGIKMFGDFIHHLVLLKKRGLHFKDEIDEEDGQSESVNLEHNKLKVEPSWTNIDNEDLTAQVMLFFSAGFETTSSLLSFALYELSASESGRAIQEKLREEVDRVMGEDGGKITYEGLKRMHLLDRVLKEALRIYPPAGFLVRMAGQPYIIPGTNLVIEEGTQIFIPMHSIQLDEKYFPNPMQFNPDRFLPENKENNVQQFSYLPFGDGPRVCIGERFAQMQIRLGLASVISKFEFEVCREKTDIPMRFKKRAFVLTAERGIWLKVKQRSDKKSESRTGTRMGYLLDCSYGDWRVTTALLFVAIIALYYYLMSPFDYWEKRGFPQLAAKPLPIFGHTFKMMIGQRYFADAFGDLYRAAGDKKYVGIYVGNQPCLLVKDAEMIRQIFIKNSHIFVDRAFEIDEEVDPLNAKGLSNLKGQRWKEMRARLSPTFTSGCMRSMLPLMQACTDELVRCLGKKIEAGGGEASVEIKEVLMCFSTDVIATCAFGVQCDALHSPETSKFRQMGRLLFQLTLKRTIIIALFLFSPRLLKWLGLKFSEEESSNFFRSFVREMVEQRERAIEREERGSGENASRFRDFIYRLVSLKKRGFGHDGPQDDDEDEDLEGLEDYKSKKSQENGGEEPTWTNVSLDDLTAQAMQFFTAGFETTSTLMGFVLFKLTSSKEGKEIQRKMRDEIDRVKEEDGGKITYEGLKKMHLLKRVINETLRLYPPVGLLNRLALQTYRLPGTNLTIEKGAQVTAVIPAMHRDEKIFPDAKHFNPDRFLPENKQKMDQMSFVPFGAGPRSCIGQRFALMESQLGLAMLLSKFEFDLCLEKTKLPLKFKKRAMILATEDGIWLNIKLRSEEK
ncbi:uncharacterized protein [Hetaerina americana]|uniref:uncharacterized protein n=1 Tax=Hetaerina americana TaxID=62018 RepID=UPI003A7F5581